MYVFVCVKLSVPPFPQSCGVGVVPALSSSLLRLQSHTDHLPVRQATAAEGVAGMLRVLCQLVVTPPAAAAPEFPIGPQFTAPAEICGVLASGGLPIEVGAAFEAVLSLIGAVYPGSVLDNRASFAAGLQYGIRGATLTQAWPVVSLALSNFLTALPSHPEPDRCVCIIVCV